MEARYINGEKCFTFRDNRARRGREIGVDISPLLTPEEDAEGAERCSQLCSRVSLPQPPSLVIDDGRDVDLPWGHTGMLRAQAPVVKTH